MRVLLTSGIFPPDIGGPATHAADVSAELRRRGHSVQVLTLTDRTKRHDTEDLVRLPRRWPWFVRIPYLLWWIARRRRDFDVIYSTGLYFESSLGAKLARRHAVLKVAGDLAWERSRRKGRTDLDFDAFQESSPRHPSVAAMRLARNLPVKLAWRTIAPSRHLAEVVDKWKRRPGSTTVILNGVSLPVGMAARPARSWNGVGLFVGRLVDHKRVDLLIEAVAKVDGFSLVVVGDGPELERLQDTARRLNVGNRIEFRGSTSHSLVLQLVDDACVLINASDWEGLPHVVLEALALGVPVIVTPSGGTEQVVIDGQNGLVVPHRDAEALAIAVTALRDNSSEYQRLATGARRTGSTLTIEALVDRLEGLLGEAAT